LGGGFCGALVGAAAAMVVMTGDVWYGTWSTRSRVYGQAGRRNLGTAYKNLHMEYFALNRHNEFQVLALWHPQNPCNLASGYWLNHAPYLFTLHPIFLPCTLFFYPAPYSFTLHPILLPCTLLFYPAPYYFTLHSILLPCTFYPAPFSRCTLSFYLAPYLFTLAPRLLATDMESPCACAFCHPL
jgi:hypothetical protein